MSCRVSFNEKSTLKCSTICLFGHSYIKIFCLIFLVSVLASLENSDHVDTYTFKTFLLLLK